MYEPTPQEKAVWDMADLVGSIYAEQMSPEQMKAAKEVLETHRIELFKRPSPRPGVAKENGGVPGAHPKQIEFWRVVKEGIASDKPERKRIFIYSAANQAGKTISAGIAFCEHIRDRAKNGDVYWVIAQSYKSLRGVPLRTLWQLIPRQMFGGRWTYQPNVDNVPNLVLDLPNGRGRCEISFRTEEGDIKELESDRITGIWWTECRREAYMGALQPRLVAKGGWIIADLIPCMPWHNELLEQARIPTSMVYCITGGIVDNQHNLSSGAVIDMMPTALGGRGVMSVEEWNLRGLGLPSSFEGVVYKQFTPEHIVEPFKVPDQWPLYMGADWGMTNPHAFLLFTVAPNEAKYCIAEEYNHGMTVFDTCKRVWNLVSSFRFMSCGQWGDADKMFTALRQEFNQPTFNDEGKRIYARKKDVANHIRREWKRVLATDCVIDTSVFDKDQADGSSLADEFELCGFPLQPAQKANKDGSVELVRRHFEQKRLFFFNTCYNAIKEHRTWRFKDGKDGIPDPDERYEKKGDHSCDSLRYTLKHGIVHSPPTVGVESFDDN